MAYRPCRYNATSAKHKVQGRVLCHTRSPSGLVELELFSRGPTLKEIHRQVLLCKCYLLAHGHFEQPVRRNHPRQHIPILGHLLKTRPQVPLCLAIRRKKVDRLRTLDILLRVGWFNSRRAASVCLENGTIGFSNGAVAVGTALDLRSAVYWNMPQQMALVRASPLD